MATSKQGGYLAVSFDDKTNRFYYLLKYDDGTMKALRYLEPEELTKIEKVTGEGGFVTRRLTANEVDLVSKKLESKPKPAKEKTGAKTASADLIDKVATPKKGKAAKAPAPAGTPGVPATVPKTRLQEITDLGWTAEEWGKAGRGATRRSVIIVPPEPPKQITGGGVKAPPHAKIPKEVYGELVKYGLSPKNAETLWLMTRGLTKEQIQRSLPGGPDPLFLEHAANVIHELPKLVKTKDGLWVNSISGERVTPDRFPLYRGTHSADFMKHMSLETDELAAKLSAAAEAGNLDKGLSEVLVSMARKSGLKLPATGSINEIFASKAADILKVFSPAYLASKAQEMTADEYREICQARNHFTAAVKTGKPEVMEAVADKWLKTMRSVKGKTWFLGLVGATIAAVTGYSIFGGKGAPPAGVGAPPQEPSQGPKKPAGRKGVAIPGGGGASVAEAGSLYSQLSNLFTNEIKKYDEQAETIYGEYEAAVDEYRDSTNKIFQKGILAKMMEEVGREPTEAEAHAVMLNAAYSLPSFVYDANIGNILKGFYAAKKAGAKFNVNDPHALVALSDVGGKAKTGNSILDMAIDFSLQKAGQEFEFTAKPKFERAKALEQKTIELQKDMIDKLFGWQNTLIKEQGALTRARIHAAATLGAAEIRAKSEKEEGKPPGFDPLANQGVPRPEERSPEQ